MEENKVVITISGIDKVGIIANFANALAESNVNIEDVSQTIMQDYFVMIVMANFEKANCNLHDFKEKLISLGKEMDMEVWVQRKKIFDKMHSI